MNTIIINGTKIQTTGNNITMINGSVFVDGKAIQTNLTGNVTIEFIGDLASLKTDGSATVNGNVKGDVDCGGSCNCGNISGSVDAGGSVTCGNVEGDVDAGGSIKMVRK